MGARTSWLTGIAGLLVSLPLAACGGDSDAPSGGGGASSGAGGHAGAGGTAPTFFAAAWDDAKVLSLGYAYEQLPR